jgi:hypothetical protein
MAQWSSDLPAVLLIKDLTKVYSFLLLSLSSKLYWLHTFPRVCAQLQMARGHSCQCKVIYTVHAAAGVSNLEKDIFMYDLVIVEGSSQSTASIKKKFLTNPCTHTHCFFFC